MTATQQSCPQIFTVQSRTFSIYLSMKRPPKTTTFHCQSSCPNRPFLIQTSSALSLNRPSPQTMPKDRTLLCHFIILANHRILFMEKEPILLSRPRNLGRYKQSSFPKSCDPSVRCPLWSTQYCRRGVTIRHRPWQHLLLDIFRRAAK